MSNTMSPDELAADNAKYAALEREMATQRYADGIDEDPPGPMEQHAEPYDQGRHSGPAHEQHEPQPQQLPQLADMLDDPVNHFDGRLKQVENYAAGQHHNDQWRGLRDEVERSEREAVDEVGDDYHAACAHLEQCRIDELNRVFPDNSEQAHVLAYQQGFQSPAHMKQALLNRDRISIAAYAAQTGQSPAALYYQLAKERGYKSPVALTKTQRKQLSSAIVKANDTGDYASFDKLWDVYEKAARKEESARR